MEINHKELAEFIRKAVSTKCSLFIHGTTGIGKSWTVVEEAKALAAKAGKIFVDWNRIIDTEKQKFIDGGTFIENGKEVKLSAEEFREKHYILVDIRISQMDPSDLRGLPNFAGNTGYVSWKPNMDFWVLSRPETSGILFLDEMNLAPPAVQAAAYQIIRDRCIGQVALSERTGVISAGNTANDRANVFEMAAPLKNRFMHVELKIPSAEEWAGNFAFDHDIDPRIISFLKFRPSLLMAGEKIIQDSKTAAFPTPRTWEMTSRMIDSVSDPRKASLYSSACIGEASSREFKTFMLMHDTINVEDVLAKPALIKEMDLQAKWVLVSAAAERYKAGKRNIKEVIDLCTILNTADKDFSISLLRMAKNYNKTGFLPSLRKHPEAMDMVGEYLKYLRDPNSAV